MNQDNAQKGKKVGADGLTKKERRALKVTAEKKDAKIESKSTGKTKNHGSEPSKQSHKSDAMKKTIEEAEVTPNAFVFMGNVFGQPVQEPIKVTPNAAVFMGNVFGQPVQEPIKVTPNAAVSIIKVLKQPVPGKLEDLSKAELKAQRRAKQEAQRNAKINLKPIVIDKKPENIVAKKVENKKASPLKRELSKTEHKHRVSLFNHLYFEDSELQSLRNFTVGSDGVHPAFLKVGEQYRSKSILGSNARCLALLSALKSLVTDFKTPPKEEYYRSLESKIQGCVSYLNNCRVSAVSMTNAVTAIKLVLTQTDGVDKSDSEKQQLVLDKIDQFIQDDIDKAGEAISIKVQEKISDGDVILTYGYSSLIKKILVDAHQNIKKKKFKVIVLDARPLLEGKEMLRRLVYHDIPCSYLLINAASFVMSRVTKVLLGAHALLANGYVMSRVGTAQIALVANTYKKPVLVCCENYKFSERAQTDSFVYNEIGDPDTLATINSSERSTHLINWRNNDKLTPLNLMYDVTPSDLVTAVVTEIGVLPCTSVPVILRIRPVE